MDEFSLIGHSVPRLESEDKVTGRLKYLDDVRIPGLLYGKILRSPHPHAVIRQIDARLNQARVGGQRRSIKRFRRRQVAGALTFERVIE